MIKITVTVTSSTLGDIEVIEELGETWNVDDSRAQITQGLNTARAKIDRALELEE